MENQNATNNTTLRQATNRVNIVGYLKKMELKAGPNDKGVDGIRGSVTIMTEPGSDHVVDVMVNRLTSKNEENRAYAGLMTVMNEYVPMAKLMEQGKDLQTAMAECTKVSVSNGNLRRSEYASKQDGSLVSRPSISTNFFNRIDDADFDPKSTKATFDVECYIAKIADEYKQDEPTGRKVVDTWIPIFGGKVIPFQFVVGENLADDFENFYEVGSTAPLNGDIVNRVIVETTAASGFGRPSETRTYVHEFEIMGGNPAYAEENSKAYTKEQIATAVRVRETETIPDILKRSKEKQSAQAGMGNMGAGFGGGYSAAQVDPGLAAKAQGFKI